MRSAEELKALEMVGEIGEAYGFGNCIQYLKNMWADKLVKQGIKPFHAAQAAGMCEADAKIYEKAGSAWLKK
jgi:hypothetical protein